jgi:hypothetical protein
MVKAAAVVAVAAMLWAQSAARGEEVALIPPPCASRCSGEPLPDLTPDSDLVAAIVTGAAAAGLAYVFANAVVAPSPRHASPLAGVPIVGAVVEAARRPYDQQASSMLILAAGMQTLGAIVTIVAGTELAQNRRLRLAVGACGAGADVAVEWRY